MIKSTNMLVVQVKHFGGKIVRECVYYDSEEQELTEGLKRLKLEYPFTTIQIVKPMILE